MNTILFVCTGNTCRSPMAACMMNSILKSAGRSDLIAISAGLSALPGEPASAGARHAMQAMGLELSAHASRPVTQALLAQAQLVVCVSPSHASALMSRFQSLPPVRSFSPAIPDPFGGSDEEYRACANAMLPQLKALAASLPPVN